GEALVGVEGATREQHPLGIGQSNLAVEQGAVEIAVDHAQPGGGDAHARTDVADPEVAGQGQGTATAHAITRDGGNGGLGAIAQGEGGGLVCRFIDASGCDVGALGGELGDVGTGAKVPTDAGQYNGPDLRVGAELGENLRQPSPHGERHRVAFG